MWRVTDQSKDFWDLAIAIVSNTNSLEKSDVKYLESLAVEKAQATAAMTVLNKTVPSRNNVHEFKVHTLEKILDDTAMIAESLGFSIFTSKKDDETTVWHLASKKNSVRAEFRGDKFVIHEGSVVDKSYAPSWGSYYPKSLAEREDIFAKYGQDNGDTVTLTSNVPFRSPNHAGGFVAGANVNAWITWKNKDGKTMDEVMRRDTA